MELKDFDFHDTLLKELRVERDMPGYKDEVVIYIGISEKEEVKLVFKDCFQADLKLNFGVIADETIFDIQQVSDDKELAVLKKKWTQIGGDIEAVNLYVIKTNSTNSILRIFAKSCEVEKIK